LTGTGEPVVDDIVATGDGERPGKCLFPTPGLPHLSPDSNFPGVPGSRKCPGMRDLSDGRVSHGSLSALRGRVIILPS